MAGRNEFLNEAASFGLDPGEAKITASAEDYNSQRPHSSLRYLTPAAYARRQSQGNARSAALPRPSSADRTLLHPRQMGNIRRESDCHWMKIQAHARRVKVESTTMSGRIVTKVCSVAGLALIAYAALGPANWQLRPMLGWKTEHLLGFLCVTLMACAAWPRPLIVGPVLMAMAGLLEALQGLTPDRFPDFLTGVSGAGGALLAAIAAAVFIRIRS